ncbi:MAG: FHA domain-containing protein [Planctomycetes bacterium]|nr:FHA domain-containing protein [Planctomycetota bacterium]
MPFIKVVGGEAKGKTFELNTDNKFLIGREPNCNLSVNDSKVSRRHAEIYYLDGSYFLKDLKSGNGTLLNGDRITECSLKHNDYFKIGDLKIVFEEKARLQAGTEADTSQAEITEENGEENYMGSSTVEIQLDKDKTKSGELALKGGKELSAPKLATLYEISKIMSTEKDLNNLMKRILTILVEATKADQGYILFWNNIDDKISARMMHPKEVKQMKISRTIVKRVAQYIRPLLTSDAMLDARLAPSHSVMMSNIKSVICVPMLSTPKGEVVLYLESDKLEWNFSESDLELVTMAGLQTGIVFSSLSATEKAHKTLMTTVKILVTASEIGNPKSQGHAERVANYSSAIALELALPKTEVRYLHLAGLLHDVGKIALNKPGEPGDTGALMDKGAHVLAAEKLLKQLSDVEEILPAIKHHHERFDGTGVPDNLKGEKIPIGARIIAVANVFDNLISYGGAKKQGIPVKEALTEIQSQGGTEFDPKVVAAFNSAYEKGSLFNPPRI